MSKKKPIGVFVVSNSLVVLVYEAENDYVVAGWSDENETIQCEIKYHDETGEPWFDFKDRVIPLNEVMRISYPEALEHEENSEDRKILEEIKRDKKNIEYEIGPIKKFECLENKVMIYTEADGIFVAKLDREGKLEINDTEEWMLSRT